MQNRVRRRTGGGYAVPPAPRPARSSKPHYPSPAVAWTQRTLDDQQAALNLAACVIPQSTIGDGDAQLLINALLVSPRIISYPFQTFLGRD